jgi:hypothetical protein
MSKFKVGDRVRVREWWNSHPRPVLGIVVGELNDCDCHAVEFPGWTHGHDADREDGSTSRWFVSADALEFVFSHPIDAPPVPAPTAVFHVIYVEDGDDTFDTQAEAEAHAEDLAADEPGAKVAVLKVVSTTVLDLAIERFA